MTLHGVIESNSPCERGASGMGASAPEKIYYLATILLQCYVRLEKMGDVHFHPPSESGVKGGGAKIQSCN